MGVLISIFPQFDNLADLAVDSQNDDSSLNFQKIRSKPVKPMPNKPYIANPLRQQLCSARFLSIQYGKSFPLNPFQLEFQWLSFMFGYFCVCFFGQKWYVFLKVSVCWKLMLSQQKYRRMLRQNILAKDRKHKLQLAEASTFQSIIKKQIIDSCRKLQSYPPSPDQIYCHDDQMDIFREKKHPNIPSATSMAKPEDKLQDLIQQRPLLAQKSRSKHKKTSLQKQVPKDKLFPYLSNSLLKDCFSLPKLHPTHRELNQLESSLILGQKPNSNRPDQDSLLLKLLDKMRQHMLLRKKGEFIHMSIKELVKFVNFVIEIMRCQREDKVSLIFQKFPNYCFTKDIVLDVYRCYGKNTHPDTKRLIQTNSSLNKVKSKSTIQPQKTTKLKAKQDGNERGERPVSVKLPSSANQNRQLSKCQIKQSIEAEFNLIQAMLQDYIMVKCWDPKQPSKRRHSIKSLEQHLLHQMEIFHKKVLNDIHLVPDVKHKLMRNIVARVFQRKRGSRDHRVDNGHFGGEPRQPTQEKSKEILSPFFRLKRLIKQQFLQKQSRKLAKQQERQQSKNLKQALQKLIGEVSSFKQNAVLSEQICAKLKEMQEFCEDRPTKRVITPAAQK